MMVCATMSAAVVLRAVYNEILCCWVSLQIRPYLSARERKSDFAVLPLHGTLLPDLSNCYLSIGAAVYSCRLHL